MARDARSVYSWGAFGLILGALFIISGLYGYNIIQWADFTEHGFFYRVGSGFNIVGTLSKSGQTAGLLAGDRILKINRKTFSNLNERRSATHFLAGETNIFLVERDGKEFEVSLTNVPLGFKKVFFQSGLSFLAGLSYFFIGTLVFLMKPHRQTGWAFYIFGACFGLLFMFLFKSGFLSPSWLGTVNLFAFCFAPATMLHLVLSFPEKRKIMDGYPWIQYLPYAASLAIFVSIRISTSEMMAIPRTWYKIVLAYLVFSLMAFLISCIHGWLRSPSEIVRVRAKSVLLGAFIATSVPILDLVGSTFFHVFFVPGFNYYLPFLVFFPLCVAYCIVKHNLFDIQTAIRRTFGYVLMTASIAALYATLVFIPAVVWGKKGLADYPGMAVASILIIIFIFNFFRQRVQRVVDRVFYRMQYDYKDIMEKIGQTMRTSLMMDQIVSRMMDIVFNSLFIEKGYVMLKTKDGVSCVSVLKKEPLVLLPVLDPFVQMIAERKKGITRYDIEEDPSFQENKETFNRTFDLLEAALIIPILFEDRLFGLLVLGEKKSGRFYQREDFLLLNFLVDQAAVAMENARLQQSRMEALEQSKIELVQLNKAKSKALNLLSHELKTPLSVISGSIQVLKRAGEKDSSTDQKQKIFQRLETHLGRLYDIQEATEKIIRSHKENETRIIGMASDGVSQDAVEQIDLYPFAQKVLSGVKSKANHRELIFELKGPETLSVRTNLVILEDAAESLLRNAVENTPDEGLIRMLLEAKDGKVILKVKDFGVGITGENRKYLFDAFHQTRESDQYATRKPYDFDAGGKGLALFRIRSYAEEFGFGFFMNSKRCSFLPTDRDSCPGRISDCPYCKRREDCLTSGGSTFWLAFPPA